MYIETIADNYTICELLIMKKTARKTLKDLVAYYPREERGSGGGGSKHGG